MESVIYDDNKNGIVTKIEVLEDGNLKMEQYDPLEGMNTIVLSKEEAEQMISDIRAMLED